MINLAYYGQCGQVPDGDAVVTRGEVVALWARPVAPVVPMCISK